MRIARTLCTLLATTAVHAAEMQVAYLVDARAFKRDAMAGASLTFALHDGPACGHAVTTATVPVEDVEVVAALKRLTPRGAAKPASSARLVARLAVGAGPSTAYLRVTGAGIVPVGGDCQLQRAGQSGAGRLVLKDENGLPIGNGEGLFPAPDGGAPVLVPYAVDGSVAGPPHGFVQTDASSPLRRYFESTDCSGTPLRVTDRRLLRLASVVGATAHYAPTTVAAYTVFSVDELPHTAATCAAAWPCATFVAPNRCCRPAPACQPAVLIGGGPEQTLDLSRFDAPFHFERE